VGLAVKDPRFPINPCGNLPAGNQTWQLKIMAIMEFELENHQWWISIAMFDYWRISILISVSIFKRQKHHHLA
jgi:hypothetical protein